MFTYVHNKNTTSELGTIATQAANAVNIDGGAIDGTTIGANSAAAGTFTTVTADGLTVSTITHGKSYEVPKIDDIYRFIDYRFKFE